MTDNYENTIVAKRFEEGNLSTPTFLTLTLAGNVTVLLQNKAAKKANREYEVGDIYENV